jgi:hypothetical protein
MQNASTIQRRPRGLEAVRARAESLPWWAWLTALVVVSIAVRFALAQTYPGPYIFNDEIVYSELARSFGHTGHLAIRGVPGHQGFGFLYSVLVSPAYALFSNVLNAYAAVHLINSVLMSLAAVPTYLIARRLTGHWLSLLAALLAVLIPSMTYTATMMTEVAFFPLVMATAWAMVAALERPTVLRQLVVFVPIVLAFFTRAQGVMLAVALATSILVLVTVEALESRSLRRALDVLRGYVVMIGVMVVGAVAALAWETARGRSVNTALGAYQGVTGVHYGFGAVTRWFFFHLGEIDVYVGVIPFAALLYCIIVGLSPREPNRSLRVFAAVAGSLVFWFGVTAAAYASAPFGHRIEERYFFHVVPLMFIALAAWVARPRQRWLALAVSGAIAAALPGMVQWDAVLDSNAVNSAFALLPPMRLVQSISIYSLAEVISLCAVGAVLLYLVVPLRLALVPVLVVLLYMVALDRHVYYVTHGVSEASVSSSISGKRTWIDDRVGHDADVAVLYYSTVQTPIWQNEFFNDSVHTIYNMTTGVFDPLPQTLVQPNPHTGVLTAADGTKASAAYVLTNNPLMPAGRLVATDPRVGLDLYRVQSPIRLVSRVDGVYPDKWSGGAVLYQRYACRGGRVTAVLLSDRQLHPNPLTITASSGSKSVTFRYDPAVTTRRMTVPLQGKGGICLATFTVPTAIPAEVTGQADTRGLGVRFLAFVYHPPR